MGVINASLVFLILKLFELKEYNRVEVLGVYKPTLIWNTLYDDMFWRDEVVFLMFINITLLWAKCLIDWMNKLKLKVSNSRRLVIAGWIN